MSSGAQEPGGTEESEEAAAGNLSPGAVVEAVCTGCKERRAMRVLRRQVSRPEIEAGAGFEDACGDCQGVRPHTVVEVHQEIRAREGSIQTDVSFF